jgi:hypothetical protein
LSSATYAKLNGDGEEVDTSLLSNLLTAGNTGKVDVAGLDKALLALDGLENLLGESIKWSVGQVGLNNIESWCLPETGKGHGKSSRASTILGLDDLITTELDAVDESLVLLSGDGNVGLDSAEDGDNGLARVSTNDGDCELRAGLLASNLGNKGLGTNDIEGGDTKESLGVEDALGLEDLGSDRNGRVDGVGNDEDVSLGGDLGGNLNEALDNASVDVEQVVTGHAGLACKTGGQSASTIEQATRGILRTGNTSRNDNDVGILHGSLATILLREVASNFLLSTLVSMMSSVPQETLLYYLQQLKRCGTGQ